MAAAILTIIAGLLAALPKILAMIDARQQTRRQDTDALAKLESDETDAARARIAEQRRLRTVQPKP